MWVGWQGVRPVPGRGEATLLLNPKLVPLARELSARPRRQAGPCRPMVVRARELSRPTGRGPPPDRRGASSTRHRGVKARRHGTPEHRKDPKGGRGRARAELGSRHIVPSRPSPSWERTAGIAAMSKAGVSQTQASTIRAAGRRSSPRWPAIDDACNARSPMPKHDNPWTVSGRKYTPKRPSTATTQLIFSCVSVPAGSCQYS
jgi:hypothetical protein